MLILLSDHEVSRFLLVLLQVCQLVCHSDDPPSANGDVVRDGLRDDGATADEVVGAGQDEAGPGELVGAGLARLRSRCWCEDALAALLAVWIKWGQEIRTSGC